MPTSERESALTRRLRELAEEERRIRQTMKQINRQLRRLERGSTEVIDKRAVAPPSPPPPPPPRSAASARRADPTEDKRFANYFASGSFVTARPLGRERRVQRNKAIFLLIFALLMGYLVYHLIL